MADLKVSLCFLLSVVTICVSVEVSFQEELLARIKSLEKHGHEQAEKIKTLEAHAEKIKILEAQAEWIKTLEVRIDDQNEKLVSQQLTINTYKDMLRELKHAVVEMQNTDADDSENSEAVENGISQKSKPNVPTQMRKHMSTERKADTVSRRMLVNYEGPVAFHAVIAGGETKHLGVNQNIVFPVIVTNLGGGYHSNHGVFIAPRAGVYIFSTSIMAYYTNIHSTIYTQIMKNGNVLAKAYAHGGSGYQDQGSVTLATQLVPGDEVWVALQGPADTSLYGEYFDSFMGCLVVPV